MKNFLNKPQLITRQQLFEMIFVIVLMASASAMSAALVQRNPNVTGDGLQYTSVVFNALQGYGYRNLPNMTWLTEPGYGLLTYLMTILVQDSELGGMLVSLVAYVLLIAAVYITVRRLSSALSAAVAALLVAFYPYLLTFSWLNLTDSAYTFFLFLCFSVYSRLLLGEGRWGSALALGVLLGCTTLIRPEGYGAALLAVVSLIVVKLIELNKQKKKRLELKEVWQAVSPTLLSAIIFSMIMFSFLVFIHQLTGAWVITPKTPNLVAATQPTNASELPLDLETIENQDTLSGEAEKELSAAANGNQALSSAAKERQAKLDILPLSVARISKNWLMWLSYFSAMGVQPLLPVVVVGLISATVSNLLKRKAKRQRQPKTARSARKTTALPLMEWEKPGFWQERGGSWRDKKILLACLVFFATSAVYLTTNLMYRYLLPYMVYVIMLLSLFIGHWVTALRLWFAPKSAAMFSVGSVLAVGLCYFFALSPSGTLFLSRALALPQMNSLPQVMNIKHLNLGARAAGIWMRDHLSYNDSVFIAASKNTQNGCYLILYQMFNRPVSHQRALCFCLTMDEVRRFLNAAGDYVILDDDSIGYAVGLQPLWKNPV
jgi:4-amino-4-deoxy-L-arabinose transferase-like glycosyltransferase